MSHTPSPTSPQRSPPRVSKKARLSDVQLKPRRFMLPIEAILQTQQMQEQKRSYESIGFHLYRACIHETRLRETMSRFGFDNLTGQRLHDFTVGFEGAKQYSYNQLVIDVLDNAFTNNPNKIKVLKANLVFLAQYTYTYKKSNSIYIDLDTFNKLVDNILGNNRWVNKELIITTHYEKYYDPKDLSKYVSTVIKYIKDTFKKEFQQIHNMRDAALSISQQDFSSISKPKAERNDIKDWVEQKCKEKINIFSQEEYGKSINDLLQLITIRMRDSKGNWLPKGDCYTREDLFTNFQLKDRDGPWTSIMANWLHPANVRLDKAGRNGFPGNKIFVRLPDGGTYVTLQSYIRMIVDTDEMEWFLKPLFSRNPIRLGNLYGEITISGNHGQKGGFVIYKAFTKEEIKNKKRAIENRTGNIMTTEYLLPPGYWNNMLFPGVIGSDIQVDTLRVDTFIEKIIDMIQEKLKRLTDTDNNENIRRGQQLINKKYT
jgi:hypothetical protein